VIARDRPPRLWPMVLGIVAIGLVVLGFSWMLAALAEALR
jgi:hypothetical protein